MPSFEQELRPMFFDSGRRAMSNCSLARLRIPLKQLSSSETDCPNDILVRLVPVNALVGISLTVEGSLRLAKAVRFENTVPMSTASMPSVSLTSMLLMFSCFLLSALPKILLYDGSPGRTKLYRELHPAKVPSSMLSAFGISMIFSFVLF